MSKHITTIPVDVAPVIGALPPKSHVHSVTLRDDHKGIEIVWDNDAIKTPFTYPVEYPLDKLMPKTVDKTAKKTK